MKKRYSIQWSAVAENDLREIIEYIARDNVTHARTVFELIREKASIPDRFPERGRIVPELRDHGIALYREIIVSPWRIVYRVSEGKTFVLSVLDSRRNVEDILLGRLIKEL